MYLRIRKADAKSGESDLVITISKKSFIHELQEKVLKVFGVDVNKQQLFYKGKLLNKDVTIFEYGIQLNDVVILKISQTTIQSPESVNKSVVDSNLLNNTQSCTVLIEKCNYSSTETVNLSELKEAESKYYKTNDLVEYLVYEYGAWFEAIVKGIFLKNSHIDFTNEMTNVSSNLEPHLVYKIELQIEDDNETFYADFHDIRPRCSVLYNFKELQTGMLVMVNYNVKHPDSLGYWYDFQIEQINPKWLKGTVYVGKTKRYIRDVTITAVNEVVKIENHTTTTTTAEEKPDGCKHCRDVKTRKCKHCGCHCCGGKHNPELILLCDECMQGFHIGCLKPALPVVPNQDHWYCSECKNDENEIVKAGEKLKFSKKKANTAGLTSERNWGSGMATIGRIKECTIVPVNHFGPVPGVEVGTRWKFRIGVSESGIHRPPVGGIHGREVDGAYSLVLSGGYEDDVDNGEEFLYTGSGGRDLSGNKREAKQSCDQKLTKMNKALAKNCNAKLNDAVGAEAENWKGGKPVRVVRNYKLGKHSEYAPGDGNRYDGIYKVVKYYPEKGQSGFLVWRYMLRRDDEAPAPWTPEGQELDMIYPPGYFEAQAAKEQQDAAERTTAKRANHGRKRVLEEDTTPNVPKRAGAAQEPTKKPKTEPHKLSAEIDAAIQDDAANRKSWQTCRDSLQQGKVAFLQKVEEVFLCICCQELVHVPVTLECNHNVCQACLKRSLALKMFFCPNCRFDLGASYKIKANDRLSAILAKLYPGYEVGR